MSGFDMDKLMQQAAEMQEQVARMQEEAEKETADIKAAVIASAKPRHWARSDGYALPGTSATSS